MTWASHKILRATLVFALLMTVSVGFFSHTVKADAVTGTTGAPGIASLSERWLRYRAITGCYSVADVGGNNIDDINAGTWMQSGLREDYRVALGYLNDDGKVSCGDGAFVTNSLSKIGFASNLDSFCAMSVAKRDGSKDDAKCMSGPGDFDMDGSKDDQVNSFRDAKAAKVSDSALFPYSSTDDGTGKILYYVGLQSLVKFCGATQGVKYDDSMAGNVRDSKRKVVVNQVDLSTGEVVRYVYDLKKDETDNISQVWAQTGEDAEWTTSDRQVNDQEMSCGELSQLTWKYDSAFGAFVKAYNTAHPEDIGSGDTGTTADTEQVCSAGALGWVFCPLVDFMSGTTSKLADYLEGNLTYQPLLNSDQGKAIQAVWRIVLSIANVSLIIAFFAVIFSQSTSIGISSYGIKKLLPRIIAAAILMNLSFFICAVAIDIANILGASVKGIIEAGISQVHAIDTSVSLQAGASGGQWAATVLLLITALAASVATGAIFLLLPVLVSAILAVLTAFLIIAARQVIITLLIIISPIAILAWVLPNTENWFAKWRKLFTAMLLMFPMVMAIFYGSLLVSDLIMTTASGDSEGDAGFMTQLIAFAVLTVPLFSLPFIMKSAGGVLDRLGILVNNRNKGLVDRSRKLGSGMQKNSRFSNALAYRKESRDVNRTVRRGRPTRFNAAMGTVGGKGYGDYTSRKATAIEDKEFEQSVSDAATGQKNLSGATLQAMAVSGKFRDAAGQERVASEAEQVSAARWLMQNGNFAQRRDLYESIGKGSSERLRQSVSSQYFAKGDNAILGAQFGGKLLEGTSGGDAGVLNAASDQINAGKVTAQALVHDADASALLKDVAANAANYGVTSSGLDSLQKVATEAMVNETTRTKAVAGNFSKSIEPMTGINPATRSQAAPSAGTNPTPPPSPQQYTTPYSRQDLQTLGDGGIRTIIQNSAGGATNLSDGDIAKIINATQGQPGLENIHQEMNDERNRRRGGGAGSGPSGPLP